MSFEKGKRAQAEYEARVRAQEPMAETTPALAGLTADQLKECLELGATLSEIKDLTASGFGYEQIASMASLLAKSRSTGDSEMMAILKQQADNQSVQNDRTRPRENQNYIAKSIFLQENGEPNAKLLKCDMYLGPHHLNKHCLTVAEVRALNRVDACDKVVIDKTDRSTVYASVKRTETSAGKLEKLVIEIPMKQDQNPQHFPPLDILASRLADAVATA